VAQNTKGIGRRNPGIGDISPKFQKQARSYRSQLIKHNSSFWLVVDREV